MPNSSIFRSALTLMSGSKAERSRGHEWRNRGTGARRPSGRSHGRSEGRRDPRGRRRGGDRRMATGGHPGFAAWRPLIRGRRWPPRHRRGRPSPLLPHSTRLLRLRRNLRRRPPSLLLFHFNAYEKIGEESGAADFIEFHCNGPN